MTSRPGVLILWQARYPWEIRISKMIRSLEKAGFRTAVLARRHPDEPARETVDGTEVFRVGSALHPKLSLPIPGNPLWQKHLRAAVREFKPDLLIVRDLPLAWTGLIQARASRLPILLDMAEHYPAAMRSWKKYREGILPRLLVHRLKAPDRLESLTLPRFTGILTVCEEMKERLEREYRLPPEKITVVRNTPELSRFTNVAWGPAQRPGRVFAYHGVFADDRDLPTVLRGFELAAAVRPELRLVLAGRGESYEDLRARIELSPAREKINLIHGFNPDELNTLYGETDFGIVALEVNEFTQTTLSNKIFDYLNLGKPVLFAATEPNLGLDRQTPIGEPYQGGDARSVRDAMLKLASLDETELMARAERAREAGRRDHHWEIDERRLLERIEGMLSRGGKARA